MLSGFWRAHCGRAKKLEFPSHVGEMRRRLVVEILFQCSLVCRAHDPAVEVLRLQSPHFAEEPAQTTHPVSTIRLGPALSDPVGRRCAGQIAEDILSGKRRPCRNRRSEEPTVGWSAVWTGDREQQAWQPLACGRMNEVSTDSYKQQASSGLRYAEGFTVNEFRVHIVPRAGFASAGESQADLADQVSVTLQHARDILQNGNARLDDTYNSHSFVDK